MINRSEFRYPRRWTLKVNDGDTGPSPNGLYCVGKRKFPPSSLWTRALDICIGHAKEDLRYGLDEFDAGRGWLPRLDKSD
jgi:hypothetical protein